MIDTSFVISWIKEDCSRLIWFASHDAICLAIIKHRNFAMRYVIDPSEFVCLEMVSRNGHAIAYIENPSEAVCLAAVKHNSFCINEITDPTEEMCIIAMKNTLVRNCINPTWANYDALQKVRDRC